MKEITAQALWRSRQASAPTRPAASTAEEKAPEQPRESVNLRGWHPEPSGSMSPDISPEVALKSMLIMMEALDQLGIPYSLTMADSEPVEPPTFGGTDDTLALEAAVRMLAEQRGDAPRTLIVFCDAEPAGVDESSMLLPTAKNLSDRQELARLASQGPVLVQGGVGSGKNTLVADHAKAEARAEGPGFYFTQIACHAALDNAFGAVVPNQHAGEPYEKDFRYEDSALTRGLTSPGVVLLDEIDLADMETQKALVTLLEKGELEVEGREGVVRLHPEAQVIATETPSAYAGRVGLVPELAAQFGERVLNRG